MSRQNLSSFKSSGLPPAPLCRNSSKATKSRAKMPLLLREPPNTVTKDVNYELYHVVHENGNKKVIKQKFSQPVYNGGQRCMPTCTSEYSDDNIFPDDDHPTSPKVESAEATGDIIGLANRAHELATGQKFVINDPPKLFYRQDTKDDLATMRRYFREKKLLLMKEERCLRFKIAYLESLKRVVTEKVNG